MAEVLPPNKRTAVLQSGETNPAVRTCSRALSDKEFQNFKWQERAARSTRRSPPGCGQGRHPPCWTVSTDIPASQTKGLHLQLSFAKTSATP